MCSKLHRKLPPVVILKELHSCTDRLFGFGDVLHLNVQVFNLHLHGLTSFNCSCTRELRLFQLESKHISVHLTQNTLYVGTVYYI